MRAKPGHRARHSANDAATDTAAPPADRRRLYLQIADKLRALIAQPDFAPHGRLPPERVLAETLGVSRPSVREALVALELEGLVEIRMGSGVYLCAAATPAAATAGMTMPGSPAPSAAERPFEAELGDSEQDIMGARRVIEGAIAAQVAPFCKPRDLKNLRALYNEMVREIEAGRIPVAADRAFHIAIAQMTDNDVLVRTVGTLFDARRTPLSKKLRDHFETRHAWLEVPDEHRAILEALEAHDPVQAQAAMQRHLRLSLERVTSEGQRAS